MDSPYALSKIMIKDSMNKDDQNKLCNRICGSGAKSKKTGKSTNYMHLSNKHFIPKTMKKHKIDKHLTYVIGDLKPKYSHLHGSGLGDWFRSGFNKVKDTIQSGVNYLKNNVTAENVKNVANKAVDAVTSDTGTAIINHIIPDSDVNARPVFPGEKHAILKLPNGKNGIANYCGPNTNVIARLNRGDPPRTKTDAVAKRHDIDYMLASAEPTKELHLEKIREADNRMINKLKQIEAEHGDDQRNIMLGMKLIQAKVFGEDAGVLDKSKFAGELRNFSDEDKNLLISNRDQLQTEGYGKVNPKLVKKFRKFYEKHSGSGLFDNMKSKLTNAKDYILNPKNTISTLNHLNTINNVMNNPNLIMNKDKKTMEDMKKLMTHINGRGFHEFIESLPRSTHSGMKDPNDIHPDDPRFFAPGRINDLSLYRHYISSKINGKGFLNEPIGALAHIPKGYVSPDLALRDLHSIYKDHKMSGGSFNDFIQSFAHGFSFIPKHLGSLASLIPGVGMVAGPVIQMAGKLIDSQIDPKYKVLDRAFGLGAGKRKRGRPRKNKA